MTDLNIKEAMATSAYGFAAVVNGILDVRTVAESERIAAIICLQLHGVQIICTKEDCGCASDAMRQFVPQATIVGVRVEISSTREGEKITNG